MNQELGLHQAPELGEMSVCCVSYPVYSILLWQPELTQTGTHMHTPHHTHTHNHPPYTHAHTQTHIQVHLFLLSFSGFLGYIFGFILIHIHRHTCSHRHNLTHMHSLSFLHTHALPLSLSHMHLRNLQTQNTLYITSLYTTDTTLGKLKSILCHTRNYLNVNVRFSFVKVFWTCCDSSVLSLFSFLSLLFSLTSLNTRFVCSRERLVGFLFLCLLLPGSSLSFLAA